MDQIARFSRYESYKDSGVDWLGKIPNHWVLYRLKTVIESEVNGIWGSDPKGINDISCIRVADFERSSLSVSLQKETKRYIPAKDLKTRQLLPGDILLEKSGGGDKTLVGQAVLFNHNIAAVCSNFVARIRPTDRILSRFLKYLFSSLYSNDLNYKHIKQTTGIQNLDSDSYFNEQAAFPSFDEQQRIANFLDQKTAEINSAIAQKQRLIKLLKEQKSILINQAVTKGLNPDVPMCDSGVEWIGEVPEHWKVKRAKYLFHKIDERSKAGVEELLSVSHMTGVTPRSEKNINMFMAEDYSGSKLCQQDDLIFNIMWAWMGALGVSDRTGIVSPSYGVYRQQISGTFNPWYLEHLVRSEQYVAEYNRRSTGLHSSRLRLYSHMFFDMEIGFPPKDEQDQIEKAVFERTSHIDNTLQAVNAEIDKLNEFRNVIISEAVTGKIKL